MLIGAFACAEAMLGGGCVSLRHPPVAVGVPSSYRLSVSQFLISCGFRLPDDDPLVLELVSLRARVHETLHLPPSSQQVEIYIFDDRPTYDRFIQTHYPDLPRRRAFFIAQDQRELVYAYQDERRDEDLRHEVCHALLHACVGAAPLWLDEGIAEYFETRGDAAGLHARHLTALQAAVQKGWRPSLTRLESITQIRQMTGPDYREAWGWVHFLLHGSPEGREVLLNYLQDLRSGTGREPLSSRLFQVLPRPDSSLIAYLERLGSADAEAVSTSVTSAGQ